MSTAAGISWAIAFGTSQTMRLIGTLASGRTDQGIGNTGAPGDRQEERVEIRFFAVWVETCLRRQSQVELPGQQADHGL